MNTLNNQQINPGNRVDFSHIRSKARVKKFQDPDGGIGRSEFQWDVFNRELDDLNGKKVKWKFNKQDQTFREFLNSQTYADFTKYIMDLNPTKFSELGDVERKYISWLNSQASKPKHQLLDENGELLHNWKDTFQQLRNKNIYGYYNLTPMATAIIPQKGGNLQEVEVIGAAKKDGTSTQDETQNQQTNTDPVTTLPPYQKGRQSDTHLGQIYGNALDSLGRQQKILSDSKIYTSTPTLGYAQTTSNYLQMQQQRKMLAEQRHAFSRQNQSGDVATQTKNRLDFEMNVANPSNEAAQQMSVQAQQQSAQAVQQMALSNQLASKESHENNDAQRAAKWNQDAINTAKHEALVASAKDAYLQNQAAADSTYYKNENANSAYYNQQVNDYMYEQERNWILRNVSSFRDDDNLAGYYNSVLAAIDAGHFPSMREEDKAILYNEYTPKDTFVQTLKPYLTASPAHEELLQDLPWFEAQPDPQTKALQKLQRKKQYIDMLSSKHKLQYNNVYDPQVQLNWQTIDLNGTEFQGTWKQQYFPNYSENGSGQAGVQKKGGVIAFRKSGGNVKSMSPEDRLARYIEQYRKQDKNLYDRTHNTNKLSQQLLSKQLDALDRQTLLLLRSIFN